MLTLDPVVQELLWRGVAERGMPAPTVVERLDVVEGVGNRFCSRLVLGAMHPLILEAVEEALRRGVIPAVALPAHRTDHAVFLQPRLEGSACILASPVGMMDQPRCRLPAKHRHGQRINHDVRPHPRLERPPHDFPVEQIEHHSEIQPAFLCPDVGQVGRPDLIWLARREVPVEQVRRHRQPNSKTYGCGWPDTYSPQALKQSAKGIECDCGKGKPHRETNQGLKVPRGIRLGAFNRG